ncbi:MAG: acetyl-CoA synthetase, partial [Methylophilus sp.]
SGAVVLVTDAAAWAGMSAKMQENIAQTPQLKHILLTQLSDELPVSGVVNVLSLPAALAAVGQVQAAYATRAEDPAYLVYT